MAKYIRSNYTRLPIFYGDDGRRVKTVYVSNIREGTTSERLEQKYSVYGPVQSCTVECHVDSDELYAIVTMDYAFDAAKILRDWPDEVKHLYSLLPKRLIKKLKETSNILPKKKDADNISRLEETKVTSIRRNDIEAPTLPIVVQNEPLISRNDEQLYQELLIEKKPKVEEIVVPVRRRRRPSSSIKTSVNERTDNKPVVEKPKIKTKRTSRPAISSVTSQNTIREPPVSSKDEPHIQTHNISSILSSPPEVVEVNPFTSLNDDCLISIFSSCDKFDLVNLSLVCERFRFIVYNYLKAKMSKVIDLSKIKSNDKITLCEAIKFLKFIDARENMQHLELSVSAFCNCEDQIILEEIFNYCGSSLSLITFTGFTFMEGVLTKWKHLFEGLKWLTFHQCVFSTNPFKSLLKCCNNLEVLDVTNSNSSVLDFDAGTKQEFSEFKCNKLKEFRLTSSRHFVNSSELIWLIEHNPHLNVLQISDVGDSIKLSGEIVQRIGKLQQMQELTFSFENFLFDVMDNLHYLTLLKELKSLNLKCDWMNISTFMKQLSVAASRQIESLSFECIDINIGFMKAIGRFRKLKYLKLENTVVNEPSQEVFEQSLMDLTFRLNNLTNFHCQMHFFTEDSLIQFVERMRKLEHLQISGLVMSLILCMRFVSVCGRRVNGPKLKIVIDNYQCLIEYLDLLKSEYGKAIEIQSLYD